MQSRHERRKIKADLRQELDGQHWEDLRDAEPPARLSPSPRPVRARARSINQQAYLDAIDRSDIVWAFGPPGCGKTRLAVAKAVEYLQAGDVKSIILVRPCVGVGRTSGFLPGDLNAKVTPYLRPLLDELRDFFPAEDLTRKLASGEIQLESLEYVRGRNFKDVFVILDEAQNATREDFDAFLSRLCEGTKYVIAGDITRREDGGLKQCDLPRSLQGSFEQDAQRFGDLPGAAVVTMTPVDIQRHNLVKMMIERGL